MNIAKFRRKISIEMLHVATIPSIDETKESKLHLYALLRGKDDKVIFHGHSDDHQEDDASESIADLTDKNSHLKHESKFLDVQVRDLLSCITLLEKERKLPTGISISFQKSSLNDQTLNEQRKSESSSYVSPCPSSQSAIDPRQIDPKMITTLHDAHQEASLPQRLSRHNSWPRNIHTMKLNKITLNAVFQENYDELDKVASQQRNQAPRPPNTAGTPMRLRSRKGSFSQDAPGVSVRRNTVAGSFMFDDDHNVVDDIANAALLNKRLEQEIESFSSAALAHAGDEEHISSQVGVDGVVTRRKRRSFSMLSTKRGVEEKE